MTYNIGPKLGDFINGLIIPSYIYQTTGKKATILISNEACTFTRPIEETYKELQPVLEKQEFVEDFQIYKKGKCDYEIFRFRESPLIFKKGWTELYFSKFLPKEVIPLDYHWLSLPVENNDNILINRTIRVMSPSTKQKYKELIKDNVKFICSDITQYEHFPYYHRVELLHTDTLYKMCQEIAACNIFIGNQSAPLAIASAFGKKRIAELRKNPDAPHYEKDKKYHKLLTTFIGD